jgi:hypothetical protein
MTAFKIWLFYESHAKEVLELIKNGTVYVDDLLSFYSDVKSLEAA